MRTTLLITMLCFAVQISFAGQANDTIYKACSNEIQIDSIRYQIQKLQDFGTRLATDANRRVIVDTIKNYFTRLKIPQITIDSFIPAEAPSVPMQYNVIASIPGSVTPEKHIILGAHYDARSPDPQNTPGADDNGSGYAGLVEIARVIMLKKYKPRSTFTFIALAAEETQPLLLGAYDYAKKSAAIKRDIKIMLCLDMLAWTVDTAKSKWQFNVEQYKGQEYLMPLITTAVAKVSSMTVSRHGESKFSDSYAFFKNGYPAVWIVENYGTASHPSGSAHPYYHKITDRLENYDLRYCTEMIKAVSAVMLYFDRDTMPSPNLKTQTITFSPIPEKILSDSNFIPPAKASSGLSVYLKSSNEAVAKIVNDSIIDITGIGNCIITAYQPGNSIYAPADSVKQNLMVKQGMATIQLQNLIQTFDGNAKYPTVVTIPPSLDYKTVFSQNGKELESIRDAGTYQITITINNTNYTGSISDSIIIKKANALITLSNVTHFYDGTAKQVIVATTPMNLKTVITYTKDGTIDNEPKNAGTYKIMASVDDKNYTGTSAQDLVISPATLSITAEDKTKIFGQPLPVFTVRYSGFVGTETDQVFLVKPIITSDALPMSPCGIYQIRVTGAQALNYQFIYVPGTLSVLKAQQEITFPPIPLKTTKSLAFNPLAIASSGLPVLYASSNQAVAIVRDSIISIVGSGQSLITATQYGNENYFPATMVAQILKVDSATSIVSDPENKNMKTFLYVIPSPASANDNSVSFYIQSSSPIKEVSLLVYDPLGTVVHRMFNPFHNGKPNSPLFTYPIQGLKKNCSYLAEVTFRDAGGAVKKVSATVGLKD